MRDFSVLREDAEFNQTTADEIMSLIKDQTKLINTFIISGEYMSSLDRNLLIEKTNLHNIAIQKRLAEMYTKNHVISSFFKEEQKKELEKASDSIDRN